MTQSRSIIQYQKGYKYQLCATHLEEIDIKPPQDIDTPFIKLSNHGYLSILRGYAWDGATCAIDTPDFMRGSLVHDALYQLMRDKYLDHTIYREQADKILRRICLEDGMSYFRAWYVYRAVRSLADFASTTKKEILFAP